MEPFRSVEVRWFQLGEIPSDVEPWFDALGPTVETETRSDQYLAPTSDALGVKLREGAVEAKRRDAVLGPLAVGASRATVEAWTKWSFPLADAADMPEDGWVEVGKERRQRFGDGVALELSRLTVDGEIWWSICLEATGPSADSALVDAARQWLGAESSPALSGADALGYPAWLRARG